MSATTQPGCRPAYLMQFREPPDSLVRRQRYDAHALLRVPQSTFTNAALHTLKDAGAPEVPSLALVAVAARSRAAISTISVWKFWRQKLADTAVNRGPLAPALLGRFSPACWDTAPMAVELEAACSPAILRSSRLSQSVVVFSVSRGGSPHYALPDLALVVRRMGHAPPSSS